MLDLLLTIYNFTIILVVIYGAYFLFISVIGMLRKNKCPLKNTKTNNHFAILIPARNEEKVISNLIHSLNNQNYPKDKYEIYVIPNNCTDNTASIAKKNKAKVLECTEKTKTKGDVLRFAFKKLEKNKKINAYIIFDADNVVHPNFLKEMNKAYQAGYRVAQGFRDAKNANDNWLSGSYNIYYILQNAFFYRARMGLNGNASINGTGFMVSKSYIEEYGFDTYTLTEDLETTGLCALRGEKIVYVPDAITYDEYPTKFSDSWKQRKRWSSGMMECRKKYGWKLIKNAFSKDSFPSLDVSLVFLGPAVQVINFVTMIMALGFKIYQINLEDLFSVVFLSGIFSFVFSICVSALISILALVYTKQKISDTIKGVIFFPVFMITWIPINVLCVFKKQTKWDEIKHTRDISINEKVN